MTGYCTRIHDHAVLFVVPALPLAPHLNNTSSSRSPHLHGAYAVSACNMSAYKANRPASINIKHLQEENPYELSPNPADVNDIEMRNHLKFTQLPQEPPPPPVPAHAPRKRVMETDMSTGEQQVSPSYKNPPNYDSSRPPQGHHFYEEVNQAALRKAQSKESEYGSPNSLTQSHTEADQAILFSHSSTTNSLAPLTESVEEKKSRKKVNPLYDSYRDGDNDTLDTRHRHVPSVSYEEGPSKDHGHSKGPAGCIGSTLRHPCTIFMLMILIVALVVFFVLLLLGTITSKAGSADPLTQPQNSSSEEVELLKKQIADQDTLISEMMATLNKLETAIVTPGNENASVDVKVAQNSYQIMTLNDTVTILEGEVAVTSEKATDALAQAQSSVSTLAALINRVTTLEGQTLTLDGQVNSLQGSLQTQGSDIVSIQGVNTQQTNDITNVESRINVVEQQFALSLSEYNDTIFQALDTISKMEGPRGYNGSDGAPGAGDLSLCSYNVGSKGSGISTGTTITDPVNAGTNTIMTGVSCSTDGGDKALLRTSGSDPVSYMCECSGIYPSDSTLRFCYIHYWTCPIA